MGYFQVAGEGRGQVGRCWVAPTCLSEGGVRDLRRRKGGVGASESGLGASGLGNILDLLGRGRVSEQLACAHRSPQPHAAQPAPGTGTRSPAVTATCQDVAEGLAAPGPARWRPHTPSSCVPLPLRAWPALAQSDESARISTSLRWMRTQPWSRAAGRAASQPRPRNRPAALVTTSLLGCSVPLGLAGRALLGLHPAGAPGSGWPRGWLLVQ